MSGEHAPAKNVPAAWLDYAAAAGADHLTPQGHAGPDGRAGEAVRSPDAVRVTPAACPPPPEPDGSAPAEVPEALLPAGPGRPAATLGLAPGGRAPAAGWPAGISSARPAGGGGRGHAAPNHDGPPDAGGEGDSVDFPPDPGAGRPAGRVTVTGMVVYQSNGGVDEEEAVGAETGYTVDVAAEDERPYRRRQKVAPGAGWVPADLGWAGPDPCLLCVKNLGPGLVLVGAGPPGGAREDPPGPFAALRPGRSLTLCPAPGVRYALRAGDGPGGGSPAARVDVFAVPA